MEMHWGTQLALFIALSKHGMEIENCSHVRSLLGIKEVAVLFAAAGIQLIPPELSVTGNMASSPPCEAVALESARPSLVK